MSDELKNGDRVRAVGNHDRTGTYVGRGPDSERPDVVWPSGGHLGYGYPAGTWERIPDEVTITIPREVRDWCADRIVPSFAPEWAAVTEACKASKAAES